MSRFVYLVGPITGTSWVETTNWREYARDRFNPGIVGLSPLRGKDYLQHETSLADSYKQHVLSTTRGIMVRDEFDCRNADVILANFLGATRVSIGSVMEIAWAYMSKKPIITVMEAGGEDFTGKKLSTGNCHEHAMLNEATSYKVDTLDAGIFVVNSILTGYTE